MSGGRRQNAGAKPKYGKTLNRVIRVPESWVEPIQSALSSQQTDPFNNSQRANQLTEKISSVLIEYKKQLQDTGNNRSLSRILVISNRLIAEIECTIK